MAGSNALNVTPLKLLKTDIAAADSATSASSAVVSSSNPIGLGLTRMMSSNDASEMYL
jgi:hypothetical protein